MTKRKKACRFFWGLQATNYPSYPYSKTHEKTPTDLAVAISNVTTPACPISVTEVATT